MLLQGDLRLELLRKRLQSKRELLRLLEKMYSCFVIGNGSSEWMTCCGGKRREERREGRKGGEREREERRGEREGGEEGRERGRGEREERERRGEEGGEGRRKRGRARMEEKEEGKKRRGGEGEEGERGELHPHTRTHTHTHTHTHALAHTHTHTHTHIHTVYCDMPIPQSPEAIVDRRLSAPDQIVLTPNGCRNSGCHDDSDDCRSSTGEMAVPILHQEEDLGDGEGGGEGGGRGGSG